MDNINLIYNEKFILADEENRKAQIYPKGNYYYTVVKKKIIKDVEKDYIKDFLYLNLKLIVNDKLYEEVLPAYLDELNGEDEYIIGYIYNLPIKGSTYKTKSYLKKFTTKI